MVNDPFADNTGEGLFVVSRGQTRFLQTALRRGTDGPFVPPDSDWHSQANAVVIKNPDGTVVTSSWLTNALDPDDANDVWGSSHSTYTGTTGLFSDGLGHLAAKVKAPTTAEVTVGSTTRFWTIEWRVKKNGEYVVKTEKFHVQEAGVLVFNAGVVTVAEVKAGITTKLTDAQIEDLIEEATNDDVRGYLVDHKIDPDKFTSLPASVRKAIKEYSRALIFDMDASAFRKVSMLQEGATRMAFAGNSTKESEMFRARGEAALARYCKFNSPYRRPRLQVIRQTPTDGEYEE